MGANQSHAANRYTTVLKTMQIMFEKGLLKRDEAQRSHVYKASVSEAQTQRQVVGHLLTGSLPDQPRNW